ncbi:MAG: hypothetical protein E3J81_08775 [Dehalococcoidia bacterium]|nr:MAG: hypothetical protein E3J81_08775 [Dehalococcoidia bacterium]
MKRVIGYWFGGIYRLIKVRRKELVCTVDADCPPGYVCVNGTCVMTAAFE